MTIHKSGFKVELQHTTWSPSKLSCYEQCPAQASYKYLHKLPEPKGEALIRGSAIHEAAELYVTGRTKKLDPNLSKAKKVLDTLRKEYNKGLVRTELDLAYTKDWESCGWMDKAVYCRFKVDVVKLDHPDSGECLIIDWKTGKFKPNGEYDQLRLYCLAVLSNSELHMEKAVAELYFTDVGEPVRRDNGRLVLSELAAERVKWDKRVKRMFADTEHAPSPGPNCRWCPWTVQKGGPCVY
jgi:hypothetical protein